MTRIAIIGAGNVGGALYRSLKGDVGEDALIVCDTHDALLEKLGARHAVGAADAAIRRADDAKDSVGAFLRTTTLPDSSSVPGLTWALAGSSQTQNWALVRSLS